MTLGKYYKKKRRNINQIRRDKANLKTTMEIQTSMIIICLN